MSSDWNEPTVDTLYVDWDTSLKARDDALATMYGNGITWTNLPTGAIRWNSSTDRFEKWNGTTWENLSTALSGTLKAANNLSDVASAATARTNLGLGTIAVENTPLDLTKGGTSSTTAAGARSVLGCGTMAVQNANAVAITGGSLTGLTGITILSGNALNFVSSGTVSGVSVLSNVSADVNYCTFGGDYWHWFIVNGTSKCYVGHNELAPFADNIYNFGDASKRWKELYAVRINSGTINSTSDLSVSFATSVKWVFSSSTFELRPNADSAFDFGTASFRVSSAYINTINGVNTSIHLSDGSDAHLRYIAGTSGSHRFYNGGGGFELWRFETGGKLVPIFLGQPDYAITYGWSNRRTITGSETLAQLTDAVATIIADLVTLGLFQ